MADQSASEQNHDAPFDELIASASTDAPFSTVFRGYDRDEVDAKIRALAEHSEQAREQIEELKQYQRKASAAVKQTQEKAERLEEELAAAKRAAASDDRDEITRLEGELAVAVAKLENAEKQITTLTDELKGSSEEGVERPRFDDVLRVAEDQAGVIINNATIHGERILEGSREDAAKNRQEAQAEADAILAQAHHEAQQARLKIETELTAHEARIEREAAHAAEQVTQAEQEAAAIRTEAEKGAAALRSLVARETAQQRADAEDAMRELKMRTMEFEASLTRRQDDAQQEFLVLHNQAVAHAERITKDANEQVAASLDHAKRVSGKADDFERLMRAQAQQIEADAALRARERLDTAHKKAQHIIEMVTAHAQSVLRDAEDRTRQLRWQQHELTSFMTEVKELIRIAAPEAAVSGDLDEESAADAGEQPDGENDTVEEQPDAEDEAAEELDADAEDTDESGQEKSAEN